ncbi:MAG: hypothetical protein Q8928_08290 [Bacteroidota bacterium]|nr:hypothetical protein [Bacteroidota bacterium]
MKNSILKMIEGLKGKIKNNLLEIQNNQKEIRNVLKQPASQERSIYLEEKYLKNKSLLSENNDFISLQLSLAKFLDKYNYSDLFENEITPGPVVSKLSGSQYFDMTISGAIPFNQEHPYFHDDAFFNKLMKHYENIEAYEDCNKLIQERYSNPV